MVEKNDALAKQGSNVVSMRPTPRSFSLMPTSLSEAMALAKLIAESDMATKDYKGKAGNVLIAIQMGADVGLKPMQAIQNIAVINGRPSIWGDAAIALVMGAGVLEKFDEKIEGEGDKRTATCTIVRKGLPDPIVRTFSVADAKKAGLWTKAGTWQNYPDRMLQMRARSFALRDGASDCLMGLSIVEEAQDITPHYGEVIDGAVANPMDRIPEGVRDNVERAFATLELTPGMRIAKINEFLNQADVTPEDATAQLLEWCKKEFAARQGKDYVPKGVVDNSKRQNAPPQPIIDAVQQTKTDVASVNGIDSTKLTASDIPFAGTKADPGDTKVGF
jgi:hypothetical protein